jgi:hypothetical protein
MVMLAGASLVAVGGATSAHAANGTLAGSVTFSQDCVGADPRGIGVGIAFDGTNLWYTCGGGNGSSNPDLLRANPKTGVVTASYNIAGGLGAIAYDAAHNVIWAGWANGTDNGQVRKITLDASHHVIGSTIEFVATAAAGSTRLDDGLAYDGTDQSLYISDDTFSTVIYHYSTSGTLLGSFPWGGNGCYNSGLAIGGNLLFQGSDGCSHVWVVDKTTHAPAFDFTTIVAGDPNFRDEGLACDNSTFGEDVMWSKEAYAPTRAHAFVVPPGTCGTGGQPAGHIFEADFLQCTTLRVGYNFFPPGVVVDWRVWQTGTPVLANGTFTTLGGGSHNHFLSIPLGITLKPDPTQTHVIFRWTIGGVTTTDKLTRDPGC